MSFTYDEFKDIFNQECSRRNLAPKSDKSLREEFDTYLEFLDFFQRDGEIIFKECDNDLSWNFAPEKLQHAPQV